jgi:hypothetical protein
MDSRISPAVTVRMNGVGPTFPWAAAKLPANIVFGPDPTTHEGGVVQAGDVEHRLVITRLLESTRRGTAADLPAGGGRRIAHTAESPRAS